MAGEPLGLATGCEASSVCEQAWQDSNLQPPVLERTLSHASAKAFVFLNDLALSDQRRRRWTTPALALILSLPGAGPADRRGALPAVRVCCRVQAADGATDWSSAALLQPTVHVVIKRRFAEMFAAGPSRPVPTPAYVHRPACRLARSEYDLYLTRNFDPGSAVIPPRYSAAADVSVARFRLPPTGLARRRHPPSATPRAFSGGAGGCCTRAASYRGLT